MKVFLSSTYKDLVEHRRLAAEAIERLGQQPTRMEVFGARPEEPVEACLREIDQCDIFVGIYAHRYGYIPRGAKISITEMEFKHAKKKAKPIFCFLVDDNHPWLPGMIDGEPERTKLVAFKEALPPQRVPDRFTTPEDLAFKIATSVGRSLPELSAPIYPVVTGLRNLIKASSENEGADRQAVADVLSSAVEVADQTLQYLADCSRAVPRDILKERALAEGWRNVGNKLILLKNPPVELAERYFLKARYWIFPEGWTDERITASKIGLEEIAQESRSLLLDRMATNPTPKRKRRRQ
jgi:hypothetical protein